MSQTVLIIENEESYVEGLRQLFESEGLTVVVRSEGTRALEEVLEIGPNLIVLAIELQGGVSGFRVCKTIKRNPDARDIPLFLLSTANNEEACDSHRSLKVRAQEYFIKPFHHGELVDRAFVYLSGGGANPEDEAPVSDDIAMEFDDDGDAQANTQEPAAEEPAAEEPAAEE